MKNKARIVGIAFVIAGCTTDSKIEPPQESSTIRIHNSTGLYIDSLVVGNQRYIKIDTGARTEYRAFPGAYRYAYVRLYSPDMMLQILPEDYVGETPLGNGRFTYVLTILQMPGEKILEIRAEKDE